MKRSSWGLLREASLSDIRLLEVREERWRHRMEERLDRKAEVTDRAEAVLVELDEGETYLLEALAVLLASSLTTRKRMTRVIDLC